MVRRMILSIGIIVALFEFSVAVDLTGCRGQPNVINALTSIMGDIYSPGYREGQNYTDDLYCQHVIQVPPNIGFRFYLTFEDFDLDTADVCMGDAVEIYEITGHIIGVFCGKEKYPPILTFTHGVRIVFRSDFMRSGKGFKIHYLVTGAQSPCTLGQRVCRNRKCIPASYACDGVDHCGDGSDEENCGYPVTTVKCGIRPSNPSVPVGVDRVIGGREAAPGSWPWQADLQLSFIHPNGHMCGGTLINSQWVVTAAHCFQGQGHPQQWRVHLGKHDKFSKGESEQIRMVEKIIVYPGIKGEEMQQVNMEHDLTLLKLNAPVMFTDSVRPACLPSQGYELTVGTKCIASGWGSTRGTGSSNVLKEVDLWVENGKNCNGMAGPISEQTMICVKNRDGFQDVCHGDSGGPLSCFINGSWHVVGATSFGTQGNYQGGLCALPESNTVYSKISNKAAWIQEQIRINS